MHIFMGTCRGQAHWPLPKKKEPSEIYSNFEVIPSESVTAAFMPRSKSSTWIQFLFAFISNAWHLMFYRKHICFRMPYRMYLSIWNKPFSRIACVALSFVVCRPPFALYANGQCLLQCNHSSKMSSLLFRQNVYRVLAIRAVVVDDFTLICSLM